MSDVRSHITEHILLESPEIMSYDGTYTGPKQILMKEAENPIMVSQRYCVATYSVKTNMEYERRYYGCRMVAAYHFEKRCKRLGCWVAVLRTPTDELFLSKQEGRT